MSIIRYQFIRETPGCAREAFYIITMWVEEIQLKIIKH